MSYSFQILHGSSYGLSNQITEYKSKKSKKVKKSTNVQKYKNTYNANMQKNEKMEKCIKLKSTQKCKLKNKIGHQLLVQKSELGRGFRDFRPSFVSIAYETEL